MDDIATLLSWKETKTFPCCRRCYILRADFSFLPQNLAASPSGITKLLLIKSFKKKSSSEFMPVELTVQPHTRPSPRGSRSSRKTQGATGDSVMVPVERLPSPQRDKSPVSKVRLSLILDNHVGLWFPKSEYMGLGISGGWARLTAKPKPTHRLFAFHLCDLDLCCLES